MQRKKLIKRAGYIIGGIIVLILLVNIGINLWLKYALPDYIKKNSHYEVNCSALNVDLATGFVQASNLKIASKNPEDLNVIALDGTANEVSISRLGIFDAVFNKKVNSSNLNLKQPNLRIRLAKPVDDRTGKKRNPIGFRNITVDNGNITIFRHTNQKYLAVNDLNLKVSNLKLTEEQVEDKLPVVFDDYTIKGNNFFFRPDNVYVLKAQNIATESGQMSVEKFEVIPLLTAAQFRRFYPKKTSLFDFKTAKMKFSDIVLTNNKIALSEVNFEEPHLKIYTSANKKTKEKPFKYVVDLQNVVMNRARAEVLKPNGTELLFAQNLNLDIDKLLMDEETAKGNIPFSYEKFQIDGQNVRYATETQNISFASLNMNPELINIRNISVKPSVTSSAKTLANLTANQIQLKINEWKFVEKKLKLDAESAIVSGLNGTVSVAEKNNNKKKPDYSGIQFPLKVKNILVTAPGLTIKQGGGQQSFNNLNMRMANLEMNQSTVQSGIPFKTGNYSITARNFSRKLNQFYNMKAGLLKMNNSQMQINNFELNPLVSRAQFIRMIPTERDLYDLKAQQITMNGNWDLASEKKFLYGNHLQINNLNANIFRSKVPADDPTVKPMYSELLRKIKFPMIINTVSITNSLLEYEEDTKKSEGPGKLTFGNFNLKLKNLNSGKSPGKPTQIPIDIDCRFMNGSPMEVKWTLDTASMNDSFTIAGHIADLPAPRINPFIEPYLKIRATGTINDLIFNFRGNKSGLNGNVQLKHKELKVSLLKETGEKNKLLSAVVNIFIKSNSADYPESVTVDNVKRDPTKSFFNLFWQGIQEGLKKTLIGKNVEQTEQSVRNTVKDVKEVTQTTGKTTKSANEKPKAEKTAAPTPAKQEPKQKEGFFQRIFKKKDKDSTG